MTDAHFPATPPTRMEAWHGDRLVRAFWPRPAHVPALLQQAAATRAAHEALVDGPRRWTWTEVLTQVQTLAGGFAAAGVQAGDRVVLWLPNRGEFVLAWLALLWRGAIAVPVSVRDASDGLRHALAQSGACGVVVDATLRPRLPEADGLPHWAHTWVVDADAEQGDWAALQQQPPMHEAHPSAGADVATILYTSGTTGVPKGAMLSHDSIVHSCMHFQVVMGLSAEDITLLAVPASHVTGLIANIATLVHCAGRIVMMREFKAADFLTLAAQERMSHSLMVPAMYKLLLLQPDFAQADLSAWRVGGYGGAPMPVATIDQLAKALPQLTLQNTYGATETTSPTSTIPAGLTRAHIDSVGVPLPCAQVRIMDEAGCEVPTGEVGEIWISGPMVVQGYWDNPTATAKEFTAGWWHSGDLGSIDAHGFVRVFDRKKDMLNRGGYKIYSVEVENTLMGLPGVVEAAVVAKPCPVLGERVHVFVPAPDTDLSLSELQAHAAAHLADYKVPESATFVDAPLPRNANGKVIKRQLREDLLRDLAAA